MKKPVRIFLGANSGAGFHSLYGQLLGTRLYDLLIVKGSPGGGKSSFMRAVARELEAAGLTAVTPPADLQKVVMSIIYDEIKRGETGSREKFGEIDSFLRQAGCDCAILGCTELSVYRTLHGLPPYYIDAMEILAEQSILRCGKRLRNV